MTNTELKLKLADYLPEELEIFNIPANKYREAWIFLKWKGVSWGDSEVKGTELLEICHRIERKMTPVQQIQYIERLSMDLNMIDYGYCPGESSIDLGVCFQVAHATWQQRATEIIQTLGTK